MAFSIRRIWGDRAARPEGQGSVAEHLTALVRSLTHGKPQRRMAKLPPELQSAVRGGANEPTARKPRYPRRARFTLLIGDEGAVLLHMKGHQVLSRQFVPDANPGNLQELRETIQKDRQAPITVVIDNIDQSFIQQTLPPVSAFSVNKLIKRRLERDFKSTDIKGAIKLGKDKEGRKDWNFLMVSVEKSPQIVLWLEFIMTIENRFRGIVLLSVEAEMFVRQLERALGIPKTGTGSEWKILVSHNKVGGFRQIILRNGRLIFTRLALPMGDPTPELIAGHIEQETSSTIEYLKRFGFSPRAGLDAYLIASEAVCKLVDPRRFDAKNYQAFSPHQVAQTLGLQNATQPTDQFGDVVLAAIVGSIRRNILKLTTIESKLYDRFQLFKYGQRLFGTFIVLLLVVYSAYLTYSTLVINSDIEDARLRKRVNEQALASLRQSIAAKNIDLDLVWDRLDLFRQLQSEVRSPAPLLHQLSEVIRAPVVLKSFTWNIGGDFPTDKLAPTLTSYNVPGASDKASAGKPPTSPPAAVAPASNAVPAPAQRKEPFLLVLRLEFPAGLKSPALFKKFAEDFLAETHRVMDGYMIGFTGVPAEYLDIKSLQMNFDQRPSESGLGKTPVTVELSIRGEWPTPTGEEAAP